MTRIYAPAQETAAQEVKENVSEPNSPGSSRKRNRL